MPRPRARRLQLIAGNWKMHKTLAESRALVEEIVARSLSGAGALGFEDGVRIGLFPPAVSLSEVARVIGDSGGIKERFIVGAQNMHYEAEGAFTGEISAGMVRSAGGSAVILGHSERRHVFGESDDMIARKVEAAIAGELTPIFCIGEQIEERDAGRTEEVVLRQLASGLDRLESAAQLRRVVVAYEPVWAIGTGRTATPAQAQEVHALIRRRLREEFSRLGGSGEESEESLILYGGSVKPENAADLLAEPDIDGALVGGASLKAEAFLSICSAYEAVN